MDGLAGDERFAVLSIDGGGVRGIFAAAVLANLECDTGTKITDHFDLIVGTSTGGIIALGLGAGMSPEEILTYYVDNVNSIFPAWRRSILIRPLSLVRAKYKPDGLRAVVREIFGDKLLCDSAVPLVIPLPTTSARTPCTCSRPRITSACDATGACRCGRSPWRPPRRRPSSRPTPYR